MLCPQSGSRRFALRRSDRLLGIRLPGSLRRSFRLLGKPALNVPQCSPPKPRKPRKPRIVYLATYICPPREEPVIRTGIYRKLSIAEIMRHNVQMTVDSFLSCQAAIGAYPCGDVQKTRICRDGSNFTWVDTNNSIGFSWVAVQGMDSICAVFKRDMKAALHAYKNPRCSTAFFHQVGFTAIHEVLDLVDKEPTLAKPFAVVCETSGNVHEVSSAVLNKKAVDFLQDKIGSCLPFTVDESIKTAIGALQHLCNQQFKAYDIWVTVWHRVYRDFLLIGEIKEHLASINRPGSGVCMEEEHLARMNRPGSGGYTMERLADISGPDTEGLSYGGCDEEHLDVISEQVEVVI